MQGLPQTQHTAISHLVGIPAISDSSKSWAGDARERVEVEPIDSDSEKRQDNESEEGEGGLRDQQGGKADSGNPTEEVSGIKILHDGNRRSSQRFPQWKKPVIDVLFVDCLLIMLQGVLSPWCGQLLGEKFKYEVKLTNRIVPMIMTKQLHAQVTTSTNKSTCKAVSRQGASLYSYCFADVEYYSVPELRPVEFLYTTGFSCCTSDRSNTNEVNTISETGQHSDTA